ncbi:MAG: EAL domain-containing protein [Gammaproteobacteria bacterium]|jgi:diguanylate cyclase (GGDEF)-like protein|nr:EAL domain-containing protein [Gammaproteobacteria bacterium]MBT6043541.1 EAL domain-containing protein [Gammaproteobacteria bacterium]
MSPIRPSHSPKVNGGKISFRAQHKHSTGHLYPVEISLVALEYQNKLYNAFFARDISMLLEAEESMRLGEESFRMIADTSPLALIISRVTDGQIQYANRQALVMFKQNILELTGVSILDLFKRYTSDQSVISVLGAGHNVQNKEIYFQGKNEPAMWLSLSSKPLLLDREKVICSTLIDVTEVHELSSQLSYQATYDDLTGLVNRREFEDRLQETIDSANEKKTENVLCYLDLDQFKVINDTCGHMAGDEMLRQLSQVLHRCIRRNDTLARLGGDEFGILLKNCQLKDALIAAENFRQVVQEFRFIWEDSTFNIGVSIGLTPISSIDESISEVLRRADTACFVAKDAGRNRIHVFHFDDQELEDRHWEMKLVSTINSALDENRMELWQQSITHVDKINKKLDSGNVHFELLLRMRDKEGNLMCPEAFLPSAERYDLATRIDRWVLDAMFNWFGKYPDQLEGLEMCAVNLSGQSLSDEKFLREITGHLSNPGIPAEKICFEITETAAIQNLAKASQFIKTLKRLGCSFALDDFGSGLSSFAYLKSLPVDFVKIDGFFVKDVVKDPVDLAMVKAINDMAHAMGKLTIAEFVEDKEILQKLVDLGVDYVQGYGIAKPAPLINESSR